MLALNLGAGLVLLVGRHTDDGAINLPAADVNNELVKRVTAADIEPGLQVLGSDGAEGVADLDGDSDANELLEAGHIGGQVCVQVVRVQGGPELGVLGGLEESGQTCELLHGLDEVGGLRGGLGFGGGGEGLGVCWEQGEAEREGGRGEHGQGLGQNVGHGIGLDKVGVELEAGFFEKGCCQFEFENFTMIRGVCEEYAMLMVSTNAWVLLVQYLHRISRHAQVYYGHVR